jgi:hypothetical protein
MINLRIDFCKGDYLSYLAFHTSMSKFHPQPSLRHALRKGRSEKAMDKTLKAE